MADGILLQDGGGILLLQDGGTLLLQSQTAAPLEEFSDLRGLTVGRADMIGGNYRCDARNGGRVDAVSGNYRRDLRDGEQTTDLRETL